VQVEGRATWVKRQRKLARFSLTSEAGCFTAAILSHDCIWAKGMTGLDPNGTDRERETALSAWFVKHPRKIPISDEEREKRAARLS
jgi:hypothetical protein